MKKRPNFAQLTCTEYPPVHTFRFQVMPSDRRGHAVRRLQALTYTTLYVRIRRQSAYFTAIPEAIT